MTPQLTLTGAGPSGAPAGVSYLLRAPFTAADQGYANAQVLDTIAEGVEDGTLTVVEVDGTLAVVSNEMAFTAQSTPTWGDLGVYSQAITRVLGRALLGTVSVGATNKNVQGIIWADSGGVGVTGWLYTLRFYNLATIITAVLDGPLETPQVVAYSASTDYRLAIVLGGYDASGNPYYAGQAKASYTYGAWFLIKGGAFANWTLLWTTDQGNTATLYAVFSNYDATGTIDDILVPDYDFSAIQVPVAYSSFTAANGTSLDAITPEVGGVFTERTGNFDIQTNRANISVASGGRDVATVPVGVSDLLADVTIRKTDGVDSGEFGRCLRYSDDNNFWMVHGDLAANQIEIVERNGGIETQRASAAIALTHTVDYDVRAIAYGQTIDAFLDGGNKCTYAAAALNEAATIHGIVGNGTGQTFDNYVDYSRTSATYDSEFAKVGY